MNNPRPNVAFAANAASHIDGGNGIGAVVGYRAMDEAIRLVQLHGTSVVAVVNSNHYGMRRIMYCKLLKLA